MIKADTTVIVGGKTYTAGQTINGLSKRDKEWMEKAGYITETAAVQKGKKEEPVEEGKTDEL